MASTFQPSDKLFSRTFVGLLIAQFLAAFNDQAIHASAMFFAFHKHLMTEAQAISLMPILFYAPWAIFCTLAGWLADRYSKRHSLVAWKFAEVGITLVALLGFWLGNAFGAGLVLACVFLMGMHSAFFVPAKYGVMPEILQPQLLSRGNGIMESLSFLAVILGTVCGGMLSFAFKGHEIYIGLVFLVLAVIGAVASMLIETMPAANPTRPFPPKIYGPLWESLKTLLGSRPLVLATIGIAFFTFVVAYMRATVYMLGEAQSPRWNEFKTSAIVGCTALGIGVGAPLAGYLSGRKIELGLIPLGGVGMTICAVIGAVAIHYLPALVVCIILIGFCTGFYLVPLYTLLQHRAPKTSKGDAIAVSNFVNVTGAIAASVVFFVVVSAFTKLGWAPPINYTDGTPVALRSLKFDEGRLVDFSAQGIRPIADESKREIRGSSGLTPELEKQEGAQVVVDRAKVHGVEHYYVRLPDEKRPDINDRSGLPGYLFLGAGFITLSTLALLTLILPDLPARASWALQTLTKPRVRAAGTHHIPLTGPVVLATTMQSQEDLRNIQSATDRPVRFVTAVDQAAAAKKYLPGRLLIVSEAALPTLPEFDAMFIPVHVGIHQETNQPRIAFGEPTSKTDLEGIRQAIAAANDVPDDGSH